MLEASDLATLEALLERKLAPVCALLARAPAPEVRPLPNKLTLAQFAWCIDRCYDFAAREVRENRGLRKFVQGTRRKLIHPAALELYGVDSGMAAERLRQFRPPSAA